MLTLRLQYLFFSFPKLCPTDTFWHSPSAAGEVRNLTFISQTSCLSKFLWPILAHQQGHIDMNLPSNVHHRIHVDRYRTNVIQMCPCLYGLSQNFCESCLNITFWPFIKRCLRFGFPFLVVCFVSAVRFDGIVAEQPQDIHVMWKRTDPSLFQFLVLASHKWQRDIKKGAGRGGEEGRRWLCPTRVGGCASKQAASSCPTTLFAALPSCRSSLLGPAALPPSHHQPDKTTRTLGTHRASASSSGMFEC